MTDQVPEQFSEQMCEYWNLMQRAQQLFLRAATTSVSKATGSEFSVIDSASVMEAYTKVGMAMAARPVDFLSIQQSAFKKMAGIWMSGWTGRDKDVSDRRFQDDSWTNDPIARACRNAHLALEDTTLDILNQLPKDSKEHLRVAFYTRQILSALAPSNFLALNPQARRKLIDTKGQSLLDGFSNLLSDLERGEGRLEIATNDGNAFVVGRDLGSTPSKVVFQNDLIKTSA